MRGTVRVLVVVSGLAAIANGQDRTVPPPAAPLTIEEAVRQAIENNLALLAERYNLSIANARILQARLRPNPVFTMGADYQDLLGRGFTAQNSAGPPELNWRVDHIIEGGGKRQRRIETAEAAKSVAELQLADSIRRLTFDVQSAFTDVILAKESLALAQENLKSLNNIVEVNRTRVRAGDLAQVEMARSEVAALAFRNAVSQAELRLQIARNKLQLLLGRRQQTASAEVAGALRRDDPAWNLEELRTQALSLRPDLDALKRDQARSQSDLRLQIAQGKIDYTAGAMYHHQYSYSDGRAFGFYLSMPLPLWNRNQGEIERAKTEQQQILARIRAVEAEVNNEVDTAYQQYTAARGLLDNIEKNMLTQAKSVREATEYSYKRGEASLVELLDAQRAFNETMQSYNEARAEYARALYLLESTSGKAAVNR
jgi:cobalt-zinc-cadmium efflux system outer membrane protein